MESWRAPQVPRLPGRGLQLRLHDTPSGQLRPAANGPEASLYVCGITPYDATHLGHAATYVAFDLAYRVWRDGGYDVRYVQNVTDVDDPLLERATQTGVDWTQLAARETELFRADMAALRVLPPTAYVGAVEAIPAVVTVIDLLRQRGATYEVDGDVYFAVSADPAFGEVSGLDAARMSELSGANGGDPERPGKKDPLDPVLWRAARPDEPAWESPYGPGRPGWHVECTAIALQHLGAVFDVQGGGSDLVFPHHEMSASHAHVVSGSPPFARAYVHAGMVGLAGEKMSKSKGNLVLVSQLRKDGVDPAAVRLALLAHHYRDHWSWTGDDLTRAEARLAHWRAAADLSGAPDAAGLVAEVRVVLADDLRAPAALAAVDRWAAAALAVAAVDDDTDAPESAAQLVDALLGVRL